MEQVDEDNGEGKKREWGRKLKTNKGEDEKDARRWEEEEDKYAVDKKEEKLKKEEIIERGLVICLSYQHYSEFHHSTQAGFMFWLCLQGLYVANVAPTYSIHTTAMLILSDYRRGLDW
jgi:hypothetical protein